MTSVAAAQSPALDMAGRPRRALRTRLARRLWPYLLLAPSLVLLAAFTYLPIVRVGWESLHDRPHGTAKSAFVGLGN